MTSPLSMEAFYKNYHGHLVDHLNFALRRLKELKDPQSNSIIYLAGDSSMDNKFWISSFSPAVNGYEHILNPALSVDDVAHNLNKEIVSRGLREQYSVINAAVEESTLGDRACCSLTNQDKFISSSLTEKDIVVMSVGGNDVALRPTLCTIANTCCIISCTNTRCIHECACGRALPCDDYCCGLCCGCTSNMFAWPCGYGYFLHLFGSRVQSYARRMIPEATKPKMVVICTIYFLDKAQTGSWADTALACLGYDRNPGHLQALIMSVYENATRQIEIPGTEVVALPLFIQMDGNSTADYIQRAEPSSIGGAKLAKLILDAIQGGNKAVAEQYDEWKSGYKMDR